jgi:hypothetical protein
VGEVYQARIGGEAHRKNVDHKFDWFHSDGAISTYGFIVNCAFSRYGSPIAANSVTVFCCPMKSRRYSVQGLADAFLCLQSRYGGCTWDALGHAGFVRPFGVFAVAIGHVLGMARPLGDA